jgi:uncharacterized repeat protein (TIGR01451 family)
MKTKPKWKRDFRFCVLSLFLVTTSSVHAAAIVNVGTLPNTLPPGDDTFSNAVDIGFPINFFGTEFSQLFVNVNGNVTFTEGLNTFTPFGLADAGTAIIAPFFADVDTSVPTPPNTGTPGTVSFGQVIIGDRKAFAVNWTNVGYYQEHNDKTNSFQLLLIDLSNPNILETRGDFAIIFNYDRILWETGDASQGTNGFGGLSAHVGFSNGTGAAGSSIEVRGSGIDGALLDSNIQTGLVHNRNPVNNPNAVPGRYIFEVLDGALARADLAIGMVADPKPAVAGQDLTFTIFVKNFGRASTTAVVRDTFPPEVTIKSVPAGCSILGQGRRIRCELGVINRAQTVSLPVVVTPNTTNTIVNTARVNGDRFDPVLENNTVTANTNPNRCRGQIVGQSRPLSIVFPSSASAPTTNQINLLVENLGTRAIELTGLTPLPDEQFTIASTDVAFPVLINGNQNVRILVTVTRPANLEPFEATAPYFSSTIRCR